MMLYRQIYQSPLADMVLLSDEKALRGAWFIGQKHFMAGTEGPIADLSSAPLQAAAAWLDVYFAGQRPDPASLTLDPKGTPFQRRVWQQLRKIPYGEITTYGELARQLGQPRAAQAIGNAVGRNPLSVIIPCHRVLGADGALRGYAGGLAIKEALLLNEGAKPIWQR